jgi:adenylate kinase family enzyme
LTRNCAAFCDGSRNNGAHSHLGASGTGTTTLGKALADRLNWPHLDADRYYWLPTDPPFTMARPREERLALLLAEIYKTPSWVFSGSAVSWASPVEPLYELVVFLRLDPTLRMERLRRRESAEYGSRIEPGGDMETASRQFLEWAAAYDTAGLEQFRSLATHELWLTKQSCPVQQLDAAAPIAALVEVLLANLNEIGRPVGNQPRIRTGGRPQHHGDGSHLL